LKGKIGKISAPFGKAARFPYEEKEEILQKATDSSVRRGGRGLGACLWRIVDSGRKRFYSAVL
jgi:hypothetical protein